MKNVRTDIRIKISSLLCLNAIYVTLSPKHTYQKFIITFCNKDIS